MNAVRMRSNPFYAVVFVAVTQLLNPGKLQAEEIPVSECPNLSGTYRYDGIKDNKSCVTNSEDKTFAYPIPLAIKSAWHIQPGKEFHLEQIGCEKIIVRYNVENSTPAEHKEEILIKKHSPGNDQKESIEYTTDAIIYRQGNKSGCLAPSNSPGTVCSMVNTASFTLRSQPNGNLQVISQKRDIGAVTAFPFGFWDTTSFKCELSRVNTTTPPVDENDPNHQQALRDHLLSPNETVKANMLGVGGGRSSKVSQKEHIDHSGAAQAADTAADKPAASAAGRTISNQAK